MTHPMFSAPDKFWKATPATLSPIIAGPPLFPGLIAASICIAISCVAPWAYCVGSTLETTPLVTEILSPPDPLKVQSPISTWFYFLKIIERISCKTINTSSNIEACWPAQLVEVGNL